jgi:FAD/FMN-containing dehydrogenase
MDGKMLEEIRKRAEAALKSITPRDFTNEAVFIVEEDVPKLLAEIERLKKTLDYINDLSAEFYTEEDENGVFWIPDGPHKQTMQEIFIVSHEAVNTDDQA